MLYFGLIIDFWGKYKKYIYILSLMKKGNLSLCWKVNTTSRTLDMMPCYITTAIQNCWIWKFPGYDKTKQTVPKQNFKSLKMDGFCQMMAGSVNVMNPC